MFAICFTVEKDVVEDVKCPEEAPVEEPLIDEAELAAIEEEEKARMEEAMEQQRLAEQREIEAEEENMRLIAEQQKQEEERALLEAEREQARKAEQAAKEAKEAEIQAEAAEKARKEAEAEKKAEAEKQRKLKEFLTAAEFTDMNTPKKALPNKKVYPLYVAIMQGNAEIVEIMLNNKVDTTQKTAGGKTFLEKAKSVEAKNKTAKSKKIVALLESC